MYHLSESQKTVIIVIGSLVAAGILFATVYAILNKLQLINKKIDPRKIRIFRKI